QQHRLRMNVGGVAQSSFQIGCADGLNGIVQRQLDDDWTRVGGLGRCRRETYKDQERAKETKP
ncbi:MAG TPA: hypothetical protein VIJ53_15355, partial [Acidobacteriaceae bacterium]